MSEDRPIPFEDVREAFRLGKLENMSITDLKRCVRGLALKADCNSAIQHHYLVICASVHNIILTKLLAEMEARNNDLRAEMNRQNTRMTRIGLFIAGIALIAGVIQTFAAVYKPECLPLSTQQAKTSVLHSRAPNPVPNHPTTFGNEVK